MENKLTDTHIDFLIAMDTADHMAGVFYSLEVIDFDDFDILAREIVMYWTSKVEV